MANTRARLMVFWMIGLMLLASFPVVPTATASSHRFTIEKAEARAADGSRLADDTLVRAGDTLRVYVNVSAEVCTPGVDTQSVQVNFQTYGIATKGDPGAMSLVKRNGVIPGAPLVNSFWDNTLTIPVEKNAGKDGPHAIGFSIHRACPQNVGNTTFTGQIQTLVFDTRGPTFASPAVSKNTSTLFQTPTVTTTYLGPGSTIRFTPAATDRSDVATLVADASELGLSPTIPLTNNQQIELRVPAAGGGVPVIDLPNRKIRLTATDSLGNSATHDLFFDIDNSPPMASLPNLRTEAVRGPTGMKVSFGWDLTGDVDTTKAYVTREGSFFGVVTRQPSGRTTEVDVPVTDVVTQDVNFGLMPLDDAGNLPVAPATSAAVHPRIGNITFGPPGFTPGFVPFDGFGTLRFTVDESMPASVPSGVAFTLRREGAGAGTGWLQAGRDGSGNDHYGSTLHQFSGATSSGAQVTFTGFQNLRLQPGTYTLGIIVDSGAGGKLTQNVAFMVDTLAPEIVNPAVLWSSTDAHGLDGNPVRLSMTVRDHREAAGAHSDSGLRNVTVELVEELEPGNVAKLASGLDARVDVTPANCGQYFTLCTADIFAGTFAASFPDLPAGNYRARLLATDNVGQMAPPITFDTTYQVLPRVGVDPNEGPSLRNNLMNVSVYASQHVHLPGPGVRCDAHACQPAKVEFYARNGDTGDGTKVRTLLAVGGRTSQMVQVEGATQAFPMFRFRESFDVAGFNLNQQQVIMVRAMAYAREGDDAPVGMTPWVRVETPLTPALNVSMPHGAAWAGRLPVNTTGTVPIVADFDARVEGANPGLQFILNRAVPTQPANSPIRGPPASYPAYREGVLQKWGVDGTKHFFGLNLTGLEEGEYHLRVVEAGKTVPATADRYFVVSRAPPRMLISHLQHSPNMTIREGVELGHSTADAFVGRTFELGLVVDHGLLNVTSTANFSYALTRASVSGNQQVRITPGQDGFAVTVKNHTPFDVGKRRTYLNLSVTLPTDARDGHVFTFDANVTTDGRSPEGTPAEFRTPEHMYLAAASLSLVHDRNPPAASVFRLETNLTGDTPTLRIRGAAEDVGSGVQAVEVRVVDTKRELTLLWGYDFEAYAPGWSDDPAAFATSALRPVGAAYARDVLLTKVGDTRWAWEIRATGRQRLDAAGAPVGGTFFDLPLDRSTVYEVNVRARDGLGQWSILSNTTVRFDSSAPAIRPDPFPHGILFNGGGPARVDWHGFPQDAEVKVFVRDNNCVTRVSLRGFDPLGRPVGPADLRPSQDALDACAAGVDKTLFHEWRVSMFDVPWMTDVVGRYKYHVEAEDAAGLVTVMPTDDDSLLRVDVIDRHQPVIRYVNVEPPLVSVNTTARIVTEVFENGAISRVEAHVSRIPQGGGAPIFMAKGTMRADPEPAANGSGRYVAETFADLGLTLGVGDYLVQVRANDTASTCTACAFSNAVLRVSHDAPPAIVPGKAGGFVNATPVLTFEVTHRDVAASGVTLQAGNSTQNLTAVPQGQLTLTAKSGPGGARIGWVVTYAPGRIQGDALVVRVSAVSNLSAERVFSYTVDAVAPVLNHTVTGLTPVAGRGDWATDATRVALSATDVNGSGVASLTYTLPGSATATPYLGPITPQGIDGPWILAYRAVDNASNVQQGTVTLNLDRRGPNVTVSQHGDAPMVIVADGGVGLDEGNVTVHYAYGNATSFTIRKLERAAGTSNGFTVALPGNASDQGLRYWFEARDRLGNVGTFRNATSPHTLGKEAPPTDGNARPQVVVSQPAQGAGVRGSVDLRWTATDADRDPLKVTIGLIEPANPQGRLLVIDGDNSGTYTLDVSRFAAGTYTFTVVVSDGKDTSEVAQRSFVVEGGKTVNVLSFPEQVVQPDAVARFAVGISSPGRNVTSAVYVVTRDGEQYLRAPLTRAQTHYEGSVQPKDPGQYKVEVVVGFEGGGTETHEVASFTVPGSEAAPTFPTSLMVLVAVALLTVALAAVGAFGRWR